MAAGNTPPAVNAPPAVNIPPVANTPPVINTPPTLNTPLPVPIPPPVIIPPANISPVKKNLPLLVATSLASLAVIVYAVGLHRWGALTLTVKPADILTLMSPLLLAAAFVERAVEVLISPWRDADASKLQKALNAAKTATPQNLQNIQNLSDALDDYRGTTQKYAFAVSLTLSFAVAIAGVRALSQMLPQQAAQTLLAAAQTAQQAAQTAQAAAAQATAAAAKTTGQAAAAPSTPAKPNAQTPAPQTPSKPTPDDPQMVFFNIVDVILTAALLAGGADGIHSVVQAFTGFFDNTSSKQTTPPSGQTPP